jgi:hypothetical protein
MVKVRGRVLPKRMDTMARRVVSSSLVFLLLAQGVAMPHSHAGTGIAEPAGHDHRPHFHFSWSWLFPGHRHDDGNADHDSHHHGHHHGHSHSHPHPHDDATSQDQRSPATEPDDEPIPGEDHDADAVYLADVFVIGKALRWVHDSPSLSLLLGATWATWDVLAREVQAPDNLPPPFIDCSPCPIYLQTLALLI